MLFCIRFESPADSSFKASGRWTVDAEDGEQAIFNLLKATPLKVWPPGSEWSLSPLCKDCPYRKEAHDDDWHKRAVHCCGKRRTPSASGRI